MQDYNQIINQTPKGEINFSPLCSLDVIKVDTQKLWEKVQTSVSSVLASRFSDNRKRTVKPFHDRIAFACPYCGDSASDSSKKRGNLFFESMNYHCFNGDCSVHLPLVAFLKGNNELSNYSLEEISFMKTTSDESHLNRIDLKPRIYQNVESLISEEALNLTVSREYFMTKFKLQEIKGSRIERYLTQRLQSDFHNVGFDPRQGQIYVFNLTKDGSRILGYQIKTFNKKNPYLTYKTSLMHKELKIFKEENKELLEKLDTISTTFGIMKLDLNKTVTVFEGPLDSFLFPNSVGVCSAKNDFPFEIDSLRYFYDNDRTGNEWSMRRLTEGFPVFLWRKFTQDCELLTLDAKIKDLNDLLIQKVRHKLKLKKFIDYFSDSKYDAIWI